MKRQERAKVRTKPDSRGKRCLLKGRSNTSWQTLTRKKTTSTPSSRTSKRSSPTSVSAQPGKCPHPLIRLGTRNTHSPQTGKPQSGKPKRGKPSSPSFPSTSQTSPPSKANEAEPAMSTRPMTISSETPSSHSSRRTLRVKCMTTLSQILARAGPQIQQRARPGSDTKFCTN